MTSGRRAIFLASSLRMEHWVAHEWRENNGRYVFNEGHWERDKQ
jgi:hypothetical protein